MGRKKEVPSTPEIMSEERLIEMQQEVGERLFTELESELGQRDQATLGEMQLHKMAENGSMYSVIATFNGASIDFHVKRDVQNGKLILVLPTPWGKAAGEDPRESREFTEENFQDYLEDARELITTKS